MEANELTTGKVLVDFYADWCGPCRVFAPVIDKVAAENDIKVIKVNVDDHQALAQKFDVQGIPTVIYLEDGKHIAQSTGALSKARLEKKLGLVQEESGDVEITE